MTVSALSPRLLTARTCSDSSIAMSGVSERARNGYLSEYLCAGARQKSCKAGARTCGALSESSHVAPGLSHEPYRRPLSRCAPQSVCAPASRIIARTYPRPGPHAAEAGLQARRAQRVACKHCAARAPEVGAAQAARAARAAHMPSTAARPTRPRRSKASGRRARTTSLGSGRASGPSRRRVAARGRHECRLQPENAVGPARAHATRDF